MATSRGPQPLEVLVVDDDTDTLGAMQSSLQMPGVAVKTAHTALAAIEHVKSTCPDVVLIAVGLSQASGYDVAEAVHQSANDPVLIALTADSDPIAKERCAEVGFDLLLTKPIDFDVVHELIISLAHSEQLRQRHSLAAQRYREARTGLVNAQIEMVGTFLKVADTTRKPETRRRCLAKARKSCFAIVSELREDERSALVARLALSPMRGTQREEPQPPPDHSEERFRLLVESVTDYAILMLDPTGRVLSWNKGAEEIKGYNASEIIGEHFSRFYPADAIASGWPEYELRVAAQQGRFEDEGWRVRKDGTRFWANVIITALRDERELVGFAKVTRDLTLRRQQEDSLRQSEERFRLLVEGVRDYAIYMLDSSGNVITWNPGAERIHGYSAGEVIGQHLSKLHIVETDQGRRPEHELEVASTEGRFEEEGWRVRKDGSIFWASVVITALRDETEGLRGFATLVHDLSDRRRTEALEEDATRRETMLEVERSARIVAQRAVELKDQFLATVSHELRTPLNAILGWTQVLRVPHKVSAQDVERGMDVIDRNARAQAQLIEDLLDFNRMIEGRLRLDLQQVSLINVVRQAIESLELAARAKALRLESTFDPIEEAISGDPGRLRQIAWNLLSNAIKFTPSGGTVRVLLQRVSSGIELTVSDTGVGIEANFLPHVFERFSQQDSSTGRADGGLGLGLAISKQLVERHGGSIRPKSDGEGKGATFIVTLPVASTRPE